MEDVVDSSCSASPIYLDWSDVPIVDILLECSITAASSEEAATVEEIERVAEDLAREVSSDNLMRSHYDAYRSRKPPATTIVAALDDFRAVINVSFGLAVYIFESRDRPERGSQRDKVFDVLFGILHQARGIASEVHCLLVNGFRDGAFGRWRTLYEMAVVAMVLAENMSSDTIDRYLAHRALAQAKLERSASEAKSGYTGRDSPLIAGCSDERAAEAIMKYGESIKSEWGWASDLVGKRRPFFVHLEEHAKMPKHYRLAYKVACKHIHHDAWALFASLSEADLLSPRSKQADVSSGGSNDDSWMIVHLTLVALRAILFSVVRILASRQNLLEDTCIILAMHEICRRATQALEEVGAGPAFDNRPK